MPEETRPDQVNPAVPVPVHHAGSRPREVTLDELFDHAAERADLVTGPPCCGPDRRRGPHWLTLVHETLFGTWANTGRTLLYWAALVTAVAALALAATPAIQAGALGLGGLWWLRHRRTTIGSAAAA
jgi:hypothetical protein